VTAISSTSTSHSHSQSGASKFFSFLLRHNIALVFVGLLIAASLISSSFLTERNITNILRQIAGLGILSMGMLLVILTRGIDLSVGSVAACGSVVCALALGSYGLPGALVGSLGVGCLFGGVAGFLVAYRKIPPFVVTLAMMTIARGITYLISNGHPIFVSEKGALLLAFDKGSIFGLPLPVILMLVVIGVFTFMLQFTSFGRLVTAIGSNEEAVRLSGIQVTRYIFATYVIAGACSALAGIVNTARSTVGSPVFGIGLELDVIASVVIGGASLNGGRGTALNTFIGVLILAVINNIMNLTNVSGYYQMVVKGLIILIAVGLQSSKRS
jgi:ribose transport system permease protein